MSDTSAFKEGTPEVAGRTRYRAPWTVLALTLALSPALVIVVARLSMNTQALGPAVAQAAPGPAALAELPPIPLSDRERLRSAGASKPMEHGLNWARAAADTPVAVAPVAYGPQVVVPDFAVTSIMVARGETIAVVKGKLRRVGESPVTGWTVSQIDPDAGKVTFTHESGRTEVVSLRSREPR